VGKPSSQPPGPVTLQCHAGREQFRRLFKAWSRQWTQPQLLKLISAGLTDNVVWSSQLTGFATGVLVDPAPKVLLALGRFNLLLANQQLPGALSTLWEGRAAMVDATGKVLGPAEMFLAFTGELNLQLPDALEIPLEVEEMVTKSFGKLYRQQLAANGIDFVDDDQQRLLKVCPSMKGLITGKAVRGEQLVTDLPVLASEVGLAQQDLQDQLAELLTSIGVVC
jgi:hypothetical protein